MKHFPSQIYIFIYGCQKKCSLFLQAYSLQWIYGLNNSNDNDNYSQTERDQSSSRRDREMDYSSGVIDLQPKNYWYIFMI